MAKKASSVSETDAQLIDGQASADEAEQLDTTSLAADEGAPAAADDRRSRSGDGGKRPLSAPRSSNIHYVNNMRNVGKIAGFVVHAGKDHFMLQQNNNVEHILKIYVNPSRVPPKRMLGRPVSVKVHVRGYRDETGVQQVSIHCLQIDRPSILDMPMQKVWAAGFGRGLEAANTLIKLSKSGFNPYDENGEIKQEYVPFMTTVDGGESVVDPDVQNFVDSLRVFGDVIEVSGGTVASRSRAGQNYFALAGCVDMLGMIPGNEFRQGFGQIMIRQHTNPDVNIPVRVTGPQAKRLLENINRGSAVLVEGIIRRKVIPDDTGAIVSSSTYIETKKISPAVVNADILNPLPDWWQKIPAQEHAERERRRADMEARKKRAAEAAASGLVAGDESMPGSRGAPPALGEF